MEDGGSWRVRMFQLSLNVSATLTIGIATIRHAPPLPNPAGSPAHAHRKDSSAAQEPRRAAVPPRRPPVALDAPHAQGGDLRLAGSSGHGEQEGHRPHRDGPCGKSSCWASCAWAWTRTGIAWNTSPITMRSCARCWACPPRRGVRTPECSATKRCAGSVALLDDELLQAINARLAAAGREVFAKKDGAPLAELEIGRAHV